MQNFLTSLQITDNLHQESVFSNDPGYLKDMFTVWSSS